MLEAGVNVVYSPENIKVHAKTALITRVKSGNKKTRYAFFGTGNFNEKIAGLYTDYALLTSNPELTKELYDTLEFTLGIKERIKLKHLLVAQVNMPEQFIQLINNEIDVVKNGGVGRITLKMNNIQDEKMISKLYEAADEGVAIDLIIRGICCLIPRKNIQLTRIVDRFLEHARVYIFHNSGGEKFFVGSADWMERNLYRRIEVVFPIYDTDIQKVIKQNIQLQLQDNTKAVKIDTKLHNIKIESKNEKIQAQTDYYNYLKKQLNPVLV